MNQRVSIPPKVAKILPLMGSPLDGEALGACRAVGRVLQHCGLTYRDLAAALLTRDALPGPNDSRERYRAGPPPQYRPSRRPAWTFTEDQTANHKAMARYCRDADNGRLSRSERNFVWSIARQSNDLTIRQADWLTAICDRLEQEDRACRQA